MFLFLGYANPMGKPTCVYELVTTTLLFDISNVTLSKMQQTDNNILLTQVCCLLVQQVLNVIWSVLHRGAHASECV